MGSVPYFQTPALEEIQKRLAPCDDFRHGFMGTDQRRLGEILQADNATVKNLGLTHKAIADALTRLTEEGKKGQGLPVTVDNKFLITVDMARGKLPCPFGDKGFFRKTSVTLKKISTNEQLAWSDLALHLIEAHGFYQGKGSPFRLDPANIAKILELTAE
jgi:hypothetical protein